MKIRINKISGDSRVSSTVVSSNSDYKDSEYWRAEGVASGSGSGISREKKHNVGGFTHRNRAGFLRPSNTRVYTETFRKIK